MENCLKTQLKESVNNNNLPVFNCIVMHVKVTSETLEGKRRIQFSNYEESTKVSVIGEGNYISQNSDFSNPTNSITFAKDAFGYSKMVYLLEGEYDIKFESKYMLWQIAPQTGSSTVIGPVSVRSSEFSNCTHLSKVYLQYMKTTGNIESFNTSTNITEFKIDESISITGSINALATLTKLVNLVLFRASNVEGDIDYLCSALAPYKENGNTLIIDARGSKVTYNGVVPNAVLTATFDGAGGYEIA